MASPADEIIVRLTADASGLSAGLDEAAAQVTGATQAMTNSARSFADVMDELAAQEDALNASLQAGTITAEAYATALAELDAQTEAVGRAMDTAAEQSAALTAAQDAQLSRWMAQDAAIAANTGELEANTAAQVENDTATAASTRTGYGYVGMWRAAEVAITALTSPVGMLAAGLAEIAIAVGYDATMQDDLTRALLATGDAAGVTNAQLDEMRSELEANGATLGEATHALADMASSGRFAGQELQTAAQAALDMATLTGDSMKQASSAVESLAETPLQSVVKLNDQFHFLTQSEYDVIYALAEGGKTAEAAKAALDDLGRTMHERAQQAAEDVGPFTRLWHAFEGGLEHSAQGLGDTGAYLLNEETPYEKRKRLTHEYVSAQIDLSNLAAKGIGPGSRAFDLEEKHLQSLETRLKALHAEMAKASADLHPAAAINYHGIGDHAPALHAIHHAAHVTHIAERAANLHDATMTSWLPPSVATEVARIQQRQVEEALAVTRTTDQAHAAHHVAMLDTQRQHVQAMASIGVISSTDAIAREQSLADAIYQIKVAELEKEKALALGKPALQAQINSELQRAADSHAAAMQSLADKSAAVQVKASESVVQPTLSAFSQITTGFVEGTLTRQQAELRLGDAIVAETINAGVQALAHHLAIEDAKTLATAEGTAERLALHVWAEAEAAAVHALHAVEWIVTEAAKAAASAFTALAGIPVVGPALAVAASVAAGAEVLSLVGKVASAEGGWDRVPYDGAPAILHKDEMVLPAELAEGVRNMAGGAGGGETHVHIHAMDSQSFGDFLRRNPAALLNALGHAHRTGHGA